MIKIVKKYKKTFMKLSNKCYTFEGNIKKKFIVKNKLNKNELNKNEKNAFKI